MQSQPKESAELKFIYQKKYSDQKVAETFDQNLYFSTIKKGIQQILIDQKFFLTILDLIKFFKFPILITLKKPIERILRDPKLAIEKQNELRKIAKIAKDIIGPSGHINQLQFLFEKGVDHSYNNHIKVSDQKRKFIDYIKSLSEHKKALQAKLKQKTITEEDILLFQSINSEKELKFFQQNLENYIKSDVKQIEARYLQMQKQKQKGGNTKKEEQTHRNPSLPKQPLKANEEQDLQDILVCCRRFFYYHEVIYQPESINVVYQGYPAPCDAKNHRQVLRTVCGLLNSVGGFLFIGVKEDKATYKKQVQGYTFIQKQKQQIKNTIYQLVQHCVLPNISQDMLKILFVPIKNKQKGAYISGKYLIKICVRYGQRKQFYSFKENQDSKKQLFAIRTDNDTKIIQNVQQILEIYKNRLLETPPEPKPIHPDPCPKPQNGKPLYQAEQFGQKQ